MAERDNLAFAARMRRNFPRIVKDTRASVLPMMAAALVPTMAMIGGGIDFGRAYLVQSKLQGAVDAGALAAVRSKQLSTNTVSTAENVGKDYIQANFPTGYLGTSIGSEKVKVTEVDDVVKAEVAVSGTVSTTLLRLVGMTTLPVSAQATAEASDTLPTSVEALLVLDNTGSMEGSRMSDLKKASKNFVSTIYGEKNTRDGFAVGILPYNTMVNVGRLVKAKDSSLVQSYEDFTDKPASDKLAWKGCVFADSTIRNISSDRFTMDTGAYDIGKTMPGEDGMPKIEPFIYPPIEVESFQDVDNRYKIPNDRRGLLAIPTIKAALARKYGDDICVDKDDDDEEMDCDEADAIVDMDELSDKDDFENAKFYSHKSGTGKSASPNNMWGASPNYQCPAQALPISYSSTKKALRDYIDDENEALKPGTGTFHNAAMTWAYRMMQRDDIFSRNRPASVPVKKVVIFMSDGNFDSRDDGRKPFGGGSKVKDTAYTAYKTYEDRLIISGTSRTDTIEHLSRRFAKTCEAMKADGLEIYTIAFAINNDSAGDDTREMFRTCATDRNTHFFAAANGADLNEAFVTIASELVNLRLTR